MTLKTIIGTYCIVGLILNLLAIPWRNKDIHDMNQDIIEKYEKLDRLIDKIDELIEKGEQQ